MNLTAFAGGLFGGLNKIAAEQRATNQAAIKASRDAMSARIKDIQNKMYTDDFQDSMRKDGAFAALSNELIGFGPDGLQLINQITPLLAEVDDSLLSWGKDPEGNNLISIPEANIKDLKPGSYEESVYNLTNFSNKLFNKDFRKKVISLLSDPKSDEGNRLRSDLGRWGTTYVELGKKDKAPPGATSLKQVTVPNVGGNFQGFQLEEVGNLMSEIFTPYHIKTAKKSLGLAPNVFALGVAANDGKSTDYWQLKVNDNQLKILQDVSAELNIAPQDFIDMYGGVNYSMLANATTTAEVEMAYKPLMVALDKTFADLQPSRLDPNGSGFLGGINNTDKYMIADYLIKELPDHVSQAAALSVHMRTGQAKTGGINDSTISQKTVDAYIKDDVNGMTMKDLAKGYKDSTDAVTKLEQLRNLMADQDMPTGAAAGVIEFFYGTVGPSGFIAQLISSQNWNTSFENTQQEQNHNMAVERYQKEINYAYSKDKSGQLGRIAALRIGLAFTLARAADPSGRLSNQDIDIQLARLGGGAGFKDKSSSIARIDQVIDETRDLQQFYKVFHDLPQGNLTKAKMLEIDGAVVAYNLRKFHQRHDMIDGVVKPKTPLFLTSQGAGGARTEATSQYFTVGDLGETTTAPSGLSLQGIEPNTLIELPLAGYNNEDVQQGGYHIKMDGAGNVKALTRDSNNNVQEIIIGSGQDIVSGAIRQLSTGAFQINSDLILKKIQTQEER